MLGWGDLWRRLTARLVRRHRDVKRFDKELTAAGGIAGRSDAGIRTVGVHQIVGSVSRWQNLRSDFFYKSGEMTGRFIRVGDAMRAGKVLPPLELYKIKQRRQLTPQEQQLSEYYVVDGHHRVAMARRLGQDYLDAHVIEYKVAGPDAGSTAPATADVDAPDQPPTTPPAASSDGKPT